MTRRIRVGIVSGCLGAPMAGVGKSALFHQVAARRLADAGITMRVSLRSIDDFLLAHMRGHLHALAAERTCDVLAFQIRPTLLRQSAVVFWKDRSRACRPRVRLSPYYGRDLNEWSPPPTLTPTVRFQRTDQLLSRLTGLRRRAEMQVVRHLEALAAMARAELRRPLVFIGPVFNATLAAPLAAGWAPLVRATAARTGVPLVDLGDFRIHERPDLFEADGFHVNCAGHAIIGERFASAVAAMLPDEPGAAAPLAGAMSHDREIPPP